MRKTAKCAQRGHPPVIMADAELLAFLKARQQYRSLPWLHQAVELCFPANRVPSLRTLSRYLAAERLAGAQLAIHVPKPPPLPQGRAPGHRRKVPVMRQDQELAAFVREHMQGHTINAVRTFCLARFPAERVPSHSTLGRYIRSVRGAARKGQAALQGDAELVAFVQENVPRMTLDHLRAACEARFPGKRAPSRSALGRVAKATRLPGQHAAHYDIDELLELAITAKALAGKVPLDTIYVACRAAFPDFKLARSTLGRYVQRYLHETYGTPVAKGRKVQQDSAGA